MMVVEKLLTGLEETLKSNDVMLFSGNDQTIKNQIIAQHAIEKELGLSQWSHIGWMQDMEIVDEGSEPVLREVKSDVHAVKDPAKAILGIAADVGNEELFILDILHEDILTDEVIDALQEMAPKLAGTGSKIIVNFHTVENDIGYVEREKVKALLKLGNVAYLHNFYPNFNEREDAVKDLLEKLMEIKTGAEFVGENGEQQRIQFEFPIDDKQFLKSIAIATEGLSTKQISTVISLSMVANKGEIVLSDVEREAEYQRGINKAAIPTDFFTDRVIGVRGRDEWVGERNYYGYAFRVLSEYIYSRHSFIHVITGGETGESILLNKVADMFNVFYDDKAKSVCVYNCDTSEVEKMMINTGTPTKEEREEDGDETREEEVFVTLRSLIEEKKGNIAQDEILRWFRETGDDKFVLIMKNLAPGSLEKESMIRYVLDVDHVSRKNIISTHPTKQPLRYYDGEAYVVFHLNE